MKKRDFIFLIMILVLVFSQTQYLKGDSITGETVTGEATNANLAISIIVSGPPGLTIINPKNQTYLNNNSIPLTYSVSSDTQSIWYSLDSGPNITIISNIHFSVSQGSHTLFLYANNSEGKTSKNITFFVNSTKFNIKYNEWEGDKKGDSTNFTDYSYEELQNFNNLTLEDTDYGKIKFNQDINLTDDSDTTDNEIDLETYINISSNKIGINSTALPNFNKSATLYLYNLSFSNPRILKDDVICSSPDCVIDDYSGGTLRFNVTGFTVYSAEETPTITPPPGGGTSGGPTRGGTKRFSLNTEEIKVKLKQGETTARSIIITNNGNQKLSMKIETEKLEKFMKISEISFDLNPSESKIIVLDILAKEDTIPDLYIGKIIMKCGGIEKEVLIAIEVESKEPLFDVKAEIPKRFLYVLPGEEIVTTITLYNLGKVGMVDVDVEYKIIDSEGKEILSEKETIGVGKQTSFVKSFEIPKEIKYGKYTLYVRICYGSNIASASAWFEITKECFTIKNIIFYILFGIAIILIFFIILEIRKIKKYVRLKYKISEKTLLQKRLIKTKKGIKKRK